MKFRLVGHWCVYILMSLSCLVSLKTWSATYYPGFDFSSGSGNITALIAAVNAANSSPDDDIIDLGGFVYIFDATSGYFSNPDGALSALPTILQNGKLSILNGSILRSLNLSTSTQFRLIYNEGDLTLFDITLENGYLENFGGGGLYNSGVLSLINAILENNTVVFSTGPNGNGAGLYNQGIINTIERSFITNNKLEGSGLGAGIYNQGILVGLDFIPAVINSINESTISGNSITIVGQGSGIFGGGIYNGIFGIVNFITNSTISDNTITTELLTNAGGGGIFNGGTMNIANSTIANNTVTGNAATGGGIFGGGTMSINNNTISGNNAIGTPDAPTNSQGGGIYDAINAGLGVSSIASLVSNIIANNVAFQYSDIYLTGNPPREGYNLISATGYGSGAFTPNHTDILITNLSQLNLGNLQDNGGYTYTMALMPGSLAINNGNNSPIKFKFDQRGNPFVRVYKAVPDIGAFELQPH